MALFDKINELRKRFIDGDQEAVNTIEKWARDAERLERMRAYFELPESKEIVGHIKTKMKMAIKKKAWSRDLDMKEAVRAEATWDELRWVLSLFGHDTDRDLSELEEIINRELE